MILKCQVLYYKLLSRKLRNKNFRDHSEIHKNHNHGNTVQSANHLKYSLAAMAFCDDENINFSVSIRCVNNVYGHTLNQLD